MKVANSILRRLFAIRNNFPSQRSLKLTIREKEFYDGDLPKNSPLLKEKQLDPDLHNTDL
jgi:hypothetical protein